MGSALTEAFATVDRSYLNAKAANGGKPEAMLSGGPGGLAVQPSSLNKAREQLGQYNGWPYVAAKAIANRIAAQSLHVGKVSSKPKLGRKLHLPNSFKSIGDSIEPLVSHELLEAFDEPNPIHTRWALLQVSTVSLVLTGAAYWWVTPGSTGTDVWYLPPSWIEPTDKFRNGWKLKPPGHAEGFDIPREDVCVFTLPDPANPFAHASPLAAQAMAVATDQSIQRSQFDSFAHGIYPQLAIRVAPQGGSDANATVQRPILEPEQRQELIEAMIRLHSGDRNRHHPLIVDGLIEGFDKLTNNAAEMDYLKSGQQTKARILQSLGVSPFIVGEMENANRASAYIAEQSFCSNTVNPLIECLSQSLTRWLGIRFANSGEKLVAWIEPCKANDAELQLQQWKAARANGDVTPNEYRRTILNLPSIEGGDERIDGLGNPIG